MTCPGQPATQPARPGSSRALQATRPLTLPATWPHPRRTQRVHVTPPGHPEGWDRTWGVHVTSPGHRLRPGRPALTTWPVPATPSVDNFCALAVGCGTMHGMGDIDELTPFHRVEGTRAGITRRRIDGSEFHRLFGTIRLSSQVALTLLVRAEAALLLVPRGVISHHTAAQIWGGIVPDTQEIHITVAGAKDRRNRPGLRCHVNASAKVRHKDGLMLTSPAQTFIDLACDLTLVDLVVLGDSLVQAAAVSADDLRLRAAAFKGAGAARAREAAALVRPGVESPMETRSRLLLVFAGFPEPEINTWVHDDDGRQLYRLDMPYPHLLLAFEYDGRQHAESAQQWGHDVGRREWLEGRGWRLMIIRSMDIFGTPWETALRARDAFAERGEVIALPQHPTERFRLHFPGQAWRTAS